MHNVLAVIILNANRQISVLNDTAVLEAFFKYLISQAMSSVLSSLTSLLKYLCHICLLTKSKVCDFLLKCRLQNVSVMQNVFADVAVKVAICLKDIL